MIDDPSQVISGMTFCYQTVMLPSTGINQELLKHIYFKNYKHED